MSLTERAIEEAIDGLNKSPADFQRLVEYYAYLTYPHRFKELVPQGRNPSGVAVKGWPDIYSRSPDGLMDVVEATHSPSWSRHLEEDLEKAEALGKGRLSGFVFVAWANEPSPLTDHQEKNPRYEQLESFRGRLTALDIPPGNINFVFKKQLVRALAQPRFAAVLTEILNLQVHSFPFRTVSASKHLFGVYGRQDVFAPAKEEYEKGLVHRAAITGEVEKRLESLGWAWLRGRGAAGKTVLAVHVGLGYESKRLPAYYLDLSKTDVGVSETLNVISTRAGDGVLFIIDNVHLNEILARDCYDHWQSVSAGSHLLLIGRDTTSIDFRGAALPLDDLRGEALTLEVTQEDLQGVFLRLARRTLHASDSPSVPPDDVLQRWHRLFGGDLIAFSAAVAQRLNQLMQKEWTVQAQDAARYVQVAYLGKTSEPGRRNLLRLAALAQLELEVPEEALELAEIEPFLQKGLVYFVGRGRDNRYGYYRLVHPGLGDLLLTAARYSGEALEQFISEQHGYIAYRNPFAGIQIAHRLESVGRVQEATLILKGIVELENGLEAILVTFGLQYFRTNSERLIRLGVLSESEIEQKVASLGPNILQSALRAPLHFLASFLGYAETKLPRVYAALAEALERPENAQALGESALRQPLGDLASFLGYAETKLPRAYAALAEALERPENAQALGESALRAPPHFLASFLGYAETKLPRAYAALAEALERPENAQALGESALRAPPHFLASFLGYAETKLPRAYAALAEALERPENAQALGESALRAPLHLLTNFLGYAETKLPRAWAASAEVLERPENAQALGESALRQPLGDLASFLGYAETKLPRVYAALAEALERPENAQALGESALREPLDNLATFLNYIESKLPIISKGLTNKLLDPVIINTLADTACRTSLSNLLPFLQTERVGQAVLLAIDKDKWIEARLKSKLEDPSFFPAMAKLLQRVDRLDLAEAPARLLIKAAAQQQWHQPTIGLHHLSYVLRSGRSAGEEAIFNFINRITTPAWLKKRYTDSPSYGIASALFSIWSYHDRLLLVHFRVGALTLRVRHELELLSRVTAPEFTSPALELLGVSALIGVRVGKLKVEWPSTDRLNDTIRHTLPPEETTTINSIAIQFWLGLRVMASMRPDPVYIQPELGERTLSLWKNSTGHTDKQNALNGWMINWLERCSRSGWKLLADRKEN